MKRIAALAFVWLLALGAAGAATFYVDQACPTGGDGTSASCLASPTTNNPKTTIAAAIALLGTGTGHTINIRGIHGTHDSYCPGSVVGQYGLDKIDLLDKSGASNVDPIIIQPFGYTTPGTGETVYLDSSENPGTWLQCLWDGVACDCDAGNQNVQIGAGGATACSETWFITGTGNYSLALGGQLEDGSPTFRVTATTDMTNATPGYNGARCSTTAWMRCNTATDCPPPETCTGSRAEVDSRSAQTASAGLLVRYGSNPTGLVRVFDSGNGNVFIIRRSAFLVIRGFNMRAVRRNHISIGNPLDTDASSHDIRITDNRMYYAMGLHAAGNGRPVSIISSSAITVDGNNIAYSDSEGIHTEAQDSNVASVLTIFNNWIHDIGDQRVMGQDSYGTSHGMILGSAPAGGTDDGNYTGSQVYGNLIMNTQQERSGSGGSLLTAPVGIMTENNSHDWVFHDNVMYRNGGECFRIEADGVAVSPQANSDNNVFYNNLLIECGRSGVSGRQSGFRYQPADSKTMNGMKFYNNTAVGQVGPFLDNSIVTTATIQNNLIRNNIMSGTTQKMVNWTPTDATGNVFDFNFVVTTAAPAITWLNVGYNCSALATPGAGNIINCPSPAFLNPGGNDFHIQAGSPARDTGTAVGMPAGRTTDINNALASAHGLPAYNDNVAIQGGVWDIGVDEYVSITPPPPAGGTGKKWRRRVRGGIKRQEDRHVPGTWSQYLECP